MARFLVYFKSFIFIIVKGVQSDPLYATSFTTELVLYVVGLPWSYLHLMRPYPSGECSMVSRRLAAASKQGLIFLITVIRKTAFFIVFFHQTLLVLVLLPSQQLGAVWMRSFFTVQTQYLSILCLSNETSSPKKPALWAGFFRSFRLRLHTNRPA